MYRWHLALVMATPAFPQNRMIYAPQVYETERMVSHRRSQTTV